MASAAVHSKTVVLLLIIHCLVLLLLFVGLLCIHSCCASSFAIISLGKREMVTLLLLFSWCHVTVIRSLPLPHGAVGWSAVCDCVISWSYLLCFSALCSKFSSLNRIFLKEMTYIWQ